MIESVAIYGAGDQGRFVAWIIEAINAVEDRFELVGFIDDDKSLHGKHLNEIPILDLDNAIASFKSVKIVAGIGMPIPRQGVMEKIASSGLETTTLVHPNVQKTRWVDIGLGTVIGAGSIISSNVKIGSHVHISFDCTIGHDVILKDYATIGPGVHIAGNVHVGKRAYIGIGAVVLNGTKKNPIIIGDDAVVGGAACVTRSVPAGLTVVGVPAKVK